MSKLSDFDRNGDPFMGAFDRKPTGLTDWPPHMEQYHWSSFEVRQEREEAKNRLYRDTLNNVAFRTYNPVWQDAEHELRRMSLEAQRTYREMQNERYKAEYDAYRDGFLDKVKIALDEKDRNWRFNTFDSEAESAAQTIRWVFEALDSTKVSYHALAKQRDELQEELKAEQQRRRPFKRLFEFLSLHKSVDER